MALTLMESVGAELMKAKIRSVFKDLCHEARYLPDDQIFLIIAPNLEEAVAVSLDGINAPDETEWLDCPRILTAIESRINNAYVTLKKA